MMVLHSVSVSLGYLDLWVAFVILSSLPFLPFQISYLKSFQINSILLLFFNSLKAIHRVYIFCQLTLSPEVELIQVGKKAPLTMFLTNGDFF